MLRPFLILSALVLTGVFPLLQQAQQSPATAQPQQSAATTPAPESKIPSEAINEVNPVKPNAQSLAKAKKIYGYDCAICHGAEGDGTGDLAKEMKSKMPDFRDPAALKGRTDGELFYIIKNGKGQMEGEGARATPEETWNLVLYLRSLAKAGATTAAGGPQ